MSPLSPFAFRCCTINVRGLSDRKFISITDYFHSANLYFCCIQETIVSNVTIQSSFSSRWRGPSFWAPAVGRRGGVAILCSDRFRDRLSVWQRDSDGRVLSLLISFGDINVNLVNLYVPTIPAERRAFLRSAHAYFFPNSRLVLAGDFNCYDSSLDKMGGNISVDSGLSDFKSSCSIKDAWRFKHPRERHFTWFKHDSSIASRLDTFFVSRFLCDSISECSILPCVYSDHYFVVLKLDLTDPARSGPGIWKFNNSLLQDEAFCSEISDLIDAYLSFRLVFPSTKKMWELLKKDFKSTSISFARDRCKELSRDKVLLTNRLIVLKRRLASGVSAVSSEILELEASLKSIFDRELEGSKIRSLAKWLEEGEAPTRFSLV